MKNETSTRVRLINKRLGARMKELREFYGYTQTQFAGILGVTFQQVQKYERGDNRLSAANIIILSNALGVDADMFLDIKIA